MALIEELRTKYKGYSDDEILQGLRAAKYPDYSLDEIKSAIGYKPQSRGLLSVANDTVIEAANAAAGAVGSAADFVSPGNAVSRFIDEKIIRPGEASQSDVVKAEKARYRSEMEGAQGIGDEIGSTLGYVARNPVLSLAQAAGSFVVPGMAVKGGGMLASLGRTGAVAERAAVRGGLAGGAVAGAALSGGDAAGTAYDLVKEAGGSDDEATEAARKASVLPAAIGAAGGVIGAERLLAGAGGFKGGMMSRALKTAGVEGVQEGIEEGVTQYEGQRAAVPFDPSIDPLKGVAGAATMGAVLGAATGGGVSLLTGEPSNPKKTVADVLAAPSLDDAIAAATEAISAGVTTDGEILPPGTKPRRANESAIAEIRALDPEQQSEALGLLATAQSQRASPAVRRFAQNRLDELLLPVRQIPVGEVIEDEAIPTGEAQELSFNEATSQILDAPTFDQRRTMGKRVPVGEATELSVEDVEPFGNIPTGEVTELGGPRPEGMAERRNTDARPLDLSGRTAVAGYIERMRGVNTPAARAFVQDFNAGRITPDDVMGLLGAKPKKAEPTADQRLAAAAAQKQPIQPGDLLTADGMPYGSRTAAGIRAKKEDGAVIPVEGGWVVRKETTDVPVADLARTPPGPAGAGDGSSPVAGGGGGTVRPNPDVGRVRGAATPEQRGGTPDAVGAGGAANAALTQLTALADRFDAKGATGKTFARALRSYATDLQAGTVTPEDVAPKIAAYSKMLGESIPAFPAEIPAVPAEIPAFPAEIPAVPAEIPAPAPNAAAPEVQPPAQAGGRVAAAPASDQQVPAQPRTTETGTFDEKRMFLSGLSDDAIYRMQKSTGQPAFKDKRSINESGLMGRKLSDLKSIAGSLKLAPDAAATTDAAPEGDFIRKATNAERVGSKPKQRAMVELSEQQGRQVVFKPYGSKGAGFYAEPAATPSQPPQAQPGTPPTLADKIKAKRAERVQAEAPVEAPAPAPRKEARRTASHPKTVMGSELLARISMTVDGLDLSLLSEYSDRFETARKDKYGRPLIQWRNPLIPGVGRLFRRSGTSDPSRIAGTLEDYGYLPPGSVERDYKAAGEAAKDMIRAALNRETVQTQDEILAEAEADQEAEREAYYSEVDAESAREMEAEREAILADNGLTTRELDALPDDDIFDGPGITDTAESMRAFGVSEQEIADEVAKEAADRAAKANAAEAVPDGPSQARQAAEDRGAAARGDGAQDEGLKRPPAAEGDRIRFTGNDGTVIDGMAVQVLNTSGGNYRIKIRTDEPAPQGGGNISRTVYSQDGTFESLADEPLLTAQTPEDLQAKADREEAGTKAEATKKDAEQERLRREAEARDNRARADATVGDFQLGQDANTQMSDMGDLFAEPATQAAAILDAAAEPPKGKERLDVLKDVKAGAITPEEVKAAYPAVVPQSSQKNAQGAIDAFNADDSALAVAIMAKLKLADLETVGAAVGFRPQIGENATRFRERIAGVADKLTKTAREQTARERKLFDQMQHLAKQYDDATQHADRAKANGVTDPDSTAFLGFYRPTPYGETTEMRIPAMLERLRSDMLALKSDPDYATVAPMVRKARPGIFDTTPAEPATPAAKSATPSASEKAAPAALDNFGKKLPPARRAMAAKLNESLTDADIANRPLSEIWPLAKNDAIEDTFAAAVAHAARAEVPAKPRVAYKVKRWVETVKTVRNLAALVVGGRLTRERLIEEVKGPRASLKDWASKVLLLEQLPREQWKRVGKVEERPEAFTYGADNKPVPRPLLRLTIDDKAHYLTGDGTVAGSMNKIRALLEPAAPERRMEFEVRGPKNGPYKVNKKGDGQYRALGTYPTISEARDAITEYNGLVAAWEAVKASDNISERDLRGAENRPRAGKDWREGKDVTPEKFQEQFGFKGGEFGKWVQQGKGDKERQALLNGAYDALMDLAQIAGIPPRAISLNGTLGIAFGSRGNGWASAHFEPSNLVINLTKTRGAGALAHEWLHAVDNYFSRMRRGGEESKFKSSQAEYRDENFITHKPEPLMIRKDGAGWGKLTKGQLEAYGKTRGVQYAPDKWMPDPKHPAGVRPEVEQRFADLVQTLNESPMTKRAMLLDGNKTGNGYWSQTLERAARAFESYVIARMHEDGYHNDFLVNVLKSDETGKAGDRYPYLLPGEIKPVADAFGALFDTIQTRTDEAGNVAMFSRAPGAQVELEAADAVGREFWRKIDNGESFTDQEVLDALSINRRGSRRTARGVASAANLTGTGQEAISWQGSLAGFGNYTSRASWDGDNFNIFFVPDSIAADADLNDDAQARDRALVHMSFRLDRSGKYELSFNDPAPGSTARQAAEDAGVAAKAGTEQKQYIRIDLAAGDVNSREVIQEGVRRLALSIGQTPAIFYPARETGARAGKTNSGRSDSADKVRQNFSRARGIGISTRDAEALVAGIRQALPNAPDIILLESVDKAPEDLREAIEQEGAEDDVEAVYHGGRIYAFPANMASVERAAFVIAHHEVRHHGMRTMYGKRLDAMLMEMHRTNPALQEATQAIKDAGRAGKKETVKAVEEALADMPVADLKKLNGWDRFIAAVRNVLRMMAYKLRKAGMPNAADAISPAKWTDRDVTAFVLRAEQVSGAGVGGVAFSRAPATNTLAARREAALFSRATPEAARDEAGRFSRTAPTPGPGIAQQRPIRQQVRNTLSDMLGSAGAKVSWWDKTLGTQYAKAEKFPAYKRVFDQVQQYLDDTSSLANEAADQAKSILPKMETWKDLQNFGLNKVDAAAVAGPVFTGTLTDKKVYDDGELRSRFKLTPAQVGQYRAFLAAVNTSLDQAVTADVLRLIGDKNPALRELAITDRAAFREGVDEFLARQIEEGDASGKLAAMREQITGKYEQIANLKSEGYAPLMRFGKYKVHITDPEGATLFFGLYESKTAANAAARDLAEDPAHKGATIEQGVLSQEQYKMFSAMPLDSLEMFAEAMGVDEKEAFQEYIKLAKNNRSAMKRLLKRKGTAGFSEDVPRVLAAFVTGNARMSAAAMNLPAAKQAALDVKDGDVQDEAVKLVEAVQNPQETAGVFRGLMFMNFIGGSIASAVVNLTQPITMTLPYLSQFGGITKASARLMAAGKMAASGKSNDLALKVALKRAEADGIVSPQEIHHLTAQAMGTFGTNPVLQRAAFIWAAPFSLAEQFNRRVTFISAYQTAKEQGIERPFEFAERAVTETQGLYNKGNAPNWARNPIGASALTFKQFSIHYLEWMGRMYRSGPKGKQAVLYALALLMLAAGTDGLPGADDLDDIIDTLGQALGYDLNLKKSRRDFVANTLGMGDVGADVVARGLSALPGIPMDVSLRMSMGNLFPATGIFLRSNTDRSRDLLEVAGPAGGLIKQYMDAGQKALRGDFGGAAIGATPVAIQNAAKAVDMWSTGEARDTLGRRVMDADTTDGLMRFLGFNPQAIARESDKMGMIRRSEQLAKNVEGEIAAAWARALVDKDMEAVADARQKLKDWNEANEDARIKITMSQLLQRTKKLRQDRSQRFITSISPERRQAVAEALQ